MEERKSRYELFLEEEARKAQPTKRCSKCGEVKALGEFYKSGTSTGCGTASACRVCTRARQNKYKSDADRFWKSYHARTKRVGNCILWIGAASKYPCITWKRKWVSVRRIVYHLAVGVLEDDMFITTTCQNKLCVRQSHLKKISDEERDALLRNSMPTGDRNPSRVHPERLPRGERNKSAKLTEDDIRTIRELYANGGGLQRELGQIFGVSETTINAIIHRKSWAHVE